jgi:hypothetical protein
LVVCTCCAFVIVDFVMWCASLGLLQVDWGPGIE